MALNEEQQAAIDKFKASQPKPGPKLTPRSAKPEPKPVSQEPLPVRPPRSWGWLKNIAKYAIVLVLVAGLGTVGYWYKQYSANESAQNELTEASKTWSDVLVKWNDAFKLAQSTPRIALATPVSQLQSIRRSASELSAPGCLADVKENALEGMDNVTSGFFGFMADQAAASDLIQVGAISIELSSMVLDKCKSPAS